MIKNLIKTYYYGEFGYFNFVILGHLENFLSKNNCLIEIRTYDDYYEILKFIFNKKIILSKKKDIICDGSLKRKYHKIQNEEFNQKIKKEGFKPLEEILNCDFNDWKIGRKKIKNLTKPLIYENINNKKYISILTRNRKLDLDRNLNSIEWIEYLKIIENLFPDSQIIFHGVENEIIFFEKYKYCYNILESIKILNNSIFFLSSMSGFAQFASNCNCSIIQIGKEYQMIPYNPFNKTNLCVEKNNHLNFKNYLLKYFK